MITRDNKKMTEIQEGFSAVAHDDDDDNFARRRNITDSLTLRYKASPFTISFWALTNAHLFFVFFLFTVRAQLINRARKHTTGMMLSLN